MLYCPFTEIWSCQLLNNKPTHNSLGSYAKTGGHWLIRFCFLDGIGVQWIKVVLSWFFVDDCWRVAVPTARVLLARRLCRQPIRRVVERVPRVPLHPDKDDGVAAASPPLHELCQQRSNPNSVRCSDHSDGAFIRRVLIERADL
jgi:hypothetical protein